MTTRAAIVRVARELFGHYGCAKTSMADLARAADLSRTALYKHFQNKEEVLRAVVQEVYAAFRLAAEDAAASADPTPVRLERLLTTKGVLHCSLADGRHGAELLDRRNPQCGDVPTETYARFHALVVEVLREGIRVREITLCSEDVPDVAATMISAVDGIGFGPDGRLVMPDVYERELARLARLLVRGVVALQ